MVIPAAMNIYAGAEGLRKMDQHWRASQAKELYDAGDGLQKNSGVYPMDMPSFVLGYEIGLATARAMLAGSGEMLRTGCDPEDVL